MNISITRGLNPNTLIKEIISYVVYQYPVRTKRQLLYNTFSTYIHEARALLRRTGLQTSLSVVHKLRQRSVKSMTIKEQNVKIQLLLKNGSLSYKT